MLILRVSYASPRKENEECVFPEKNTNTGLQTHAHKPKHTHRTSQVQQDKQLHSVDRGLPGQPEQHNVVRLMNRPEMTLSPWT